MSYELIVSVKDGQTMLASNEAFPAAVERVEFYAQTRLLVVVFADDPEGRLMNLEIDEKLIPALQANARILVVSMKDNAPAEGYEVPLVQIG